MSGEARLRDAASGPSRRASPRGKRGRCADLRSRRRHGCVSAQPSIKYGGRRPGRSASRRPSRPWCSTTCGVASASRPTAGSRPGRDVAIAALLGADEYGFSTAPSRGPRLHPDARLSPEHVPGRHRDPATRCCASASRASRITWSVTFYFVAEEAAGVSWPSSASAPLDEMIGRVDRLEADAATPVTGRPGVSTSRTCSTSRTFPTRSATAKKQDYGVCSSVVIDVELLERAAPALERGEAVEIDLPIHNTDRAACTILELRGVAEATVRRACRTDKIDDALHGLRGPEPRRLRSQPGIAIDRRGRHQRLLRQGARRAGKASSVRVPEGSTFDPARQHRDGQRRRSTAPPGARRTSRGSRANASACATAARTAVVEGDRRPRLRVHDRRSRGRRARPHGPQLRRRACAGASRTCSTLEGDFPEIASTSRGSLLETMTAEEDLDLDPPNLVANGIYELHAQRARQGGPPQVEYPTRRSFVKVFPTDLKLALDVRLAVPERRWVR